MLAAAIGLVPAAAFGGVAACAIVSLWAWLFPELRRIERVEDVKPAT